MIHRLAGPFEPHTPSSTVCAMASPLELARSWVDDGTVPGVAVCIVDRAGVVDELYAGVLRRGGDAPITADSRFALASLTKPLVAAACLCAVEEELAELDDEIRDGFTLRHLLSHCSGLGADAADLDAPLLDRPGTYRRYSNAGYALAARTIEQVADMSFREYLEHALLAPLEMDASLGLDPSDAVRTAVVREPGVWRDGEPFFNGDAFRAAGLAESGGYASARGYARYLSLLLARGELRGAPLLAPETIDEMLATQFGELPGSVAGVASWDACGWGLGLDVRGTREPHWTGDALTPTANTHFGSSGTLAFVDRERGIGLVALANRGSYSGWWARPGGWADLCAAVIAARWPQT
jgi:CubicO group peptidase (beta-lactamase class C family)